MPKWTRSSEMGFCRPAKEADISLSATKVSCANQLTREMVDSMKVAVWIAQKAAVTVNTVPGEIFNCVKGLVTPIFSGLPADGSLTALWLTSKLIC